MGRLSNRDVDALVQSEYEDALANGEPWAVESYEYRKAMVKPAGESAGAPPPGGDSLTDTPEEQGAERDG